MESNTIEDLHKEDHKRIIQQMDVTTDVTILKEKVEELRADKEKESQWKMRLMSMLSMALVVLSGALIKMYSDSQLNVTAINKLEVVVGENNRKFGVQNSWIEQNFVERDEFQLFREAVNVEIQDRKNYNDKLYERFNDHVIDHPHQK